MIYKCLYTGVQPMNVCLGRAWLTIVITMKLIVSPNIMKISLSNGVEVFLLTILVFNSLKSTTGLFLSFAFLTTNMSGKVWVVLFLVRIPRETNFCMHLSMRGLSSSTIGKGLTKKVEGSLTFIFTFISGHFPISSLRPKAFL